MEIAIAPPESTETPFAKDILWRVRLLGLTDEELVVEQPVALGKVIDLEPGLELVAILSIGQNRWMFQSRHLGLQPPNPNDRRPTTGIRLAMPESVERCQRRHYYRIETTSLTLPDVDVWPLLDPKSVIVAERANELVTDQGQGGEATEPPTSFKLPEVGPRFGATLINLGGGGVGLHVASGDAQAFQRHRVFWMRVPLPPEVSTPICATAKMVHLHMSASQDYYAGMAFDFTFNPGHQQFVVNQISHYIAMQQRAQFTRRSA